jgi:DNA polymerase III alpha subunit (gram-positive type)
MSEREIYVSVDIEADGPIPSINSMLSFGAAAFTPEGEMIATFEANLELLSGATPDEKTMTEFWAKNPEAWAACRTNLQSPEKAMKDFVAWTNALPGLPVMDCYPAGFDFTFMYWYMRRFAGESPYSFSCLDIKSYAMALLGTTFRQSTKRNFPKEWSRKNKRHNHKALDDAIGQGQLFTKMLKWRGCRTLGVDLDAI